MQSTPTTSESIAHGTTRGYVTQKCRCEECREAHRAYMAAYRIRKFGARAPREINGYRAVHNLLSRTRGKASRYQCDFCGGSAEEWALDNDAEHTIRGDVYGATLTWSENLDDYRPLCVKCHRAYDLGGREIGGRVRRLVCRSGHDLTGEGATRVRQYDGATECVACARARTRRFRSKRRCDTHKTPL